jgi:hypothetical protein
MSLGLPRRKFEELWPSISILRLSGYNPYTTIASSLHVSSGLVELRLKGWHPVTETTLIGILIASPHLRVLEISTDIIGSLSKGPSIDPIYLPSLEIVKSTIPNRPLTHQRQMRILLRLLKPGSNPLSLSISNPNIGTGEIFVCQPEVKAFFQRSNITQLCVYSIESRSQLVELLTLVPSVRVLAIPYFNTLIPDVDSIPDVPSLERLYVSPSFASLSSRQGMSLSLKWSNVEWLARTYKFRSLTVWSQEMGYHSREPGGFLEDMIPPHFYVIFPIVYVGASDRSDPFPVHEWC